MKPLIIANWKMNPQSLAEAERLFNSVKKGIKNIKEIEIVICPPFIYIPTVQHSSIPTIKIGAQDCFWEGSGPFTGQISPLMLKNLGCQYVIIGHSARRELGETDEMINKKLRAAIKAKLKPILCVGETEKERKKDKTFKILREQLEKGLKGISLFKVYSLKFIVAYEPVWAIGTGNPCGPKEAKEVLLFLRKFVQPLFHSNTRPLILYGGSVNSKNAKDYIDIGFDGLLVGGASLNSEEFIKIVKEASKD